MMNSQNIWLQHGWDSRQCIWILEASPYIRQQQHTKRETQGKKYLKRQTNQQSKSFYFAPNRKRHCTFLLLPAWDCSIRKSKMPFFPTSGRKISSSSFFFTNLHIFYFLKVRSLEAVFPPNSIYWSLRQYLWWNYGNVASPHLGNISLEFQKLGCSTITFWRISNSFAGGTDDLLSINYEHSTMGASMMWSHVCK